MKNPFFLYLMLSLFTLSCTVAEKNSSNKETSPKEKTVFQTSNPWKPVIDVRADVAIIYSVKDHHEQGNMTFEERVQSWRDRGYTTHFMSGIAWGEYQDYFTEIGRAHV